MLSKYLQILLLCLTVALARPADPGQSDQSICRSGFGCLPFGNPSWNTFTVTLPVENDPIARQENSPGAELTVEMWNRQDRTVFIGVRRYDGYRLNHFDHI